MFLRILWRLLCASKGRLVLALLAVTSGATVCAALLNLDFDANQKLTREFRVLGANIVVTPKQAAATVQAPTGAPALEQSSAQVEAASVTMDDAVMRKIDGLRSPEVLASAPYLYVIVQAGDGKTSVPVILAGTWFDQVAKMNSWWKVEGQWVTTRDDRMHCMVGLEAARRLGLAPGDRLVLRYAGHEAALAVAGVVTAGGSEDSQVFASLPVVQDLAALPGRISLAQISALGSAPVVENVILRLSGALPDFTVQPVRQLAAAEGRLLDRIHGLLFATVALILALTGLGVLATMAGLAIERRRDVGLMKALGGSVRQVMRFFLAEAATVGLAGGLAGCAAGMVLSAWVGEHVFAAATSPRLLVLPITLALTVFITLAGALPLRFLGRVRPADILRGE